MNFVSSGIGIVILGLAITGLYDFLNLKRAFRWLRMRMGAMCTFWWESLWGRVVETRKKPVQWSPDPGDLSRLKAVLDQQYSTYSNASREDPAAEANKLEGEELDTSTVSSDEVVAYVQLNVPLARTFHEKLVEFVYDGWEWVSETVLQKVEVVDKEFLAKAISALEAALKYDTSSTLQIDGWGLFHCKSDGQIHLLKLEDGVHLVPAIISVSGFDIEGRNLYQAAIRVSTQDSSELLQPLEMELEELTRGLHKLFVTIPRLYKKLSAVYITTLTSIVEGDKELVVRSRATSFLMDPSLTSGAAAVIFVRAIMKKAVIFVRAIMKKAEILVGAIMKKAVILVGAIMKKAVILVGAIMKNRLHRLSFSRRRRDLRQAEADNEPEAVIVDIEPLLALCVDPQPSQPTQSTSSRRSGHSETVPVRFDGAEDPQPAQPTQPTSSRRNGHSETEPVPFDGAEDPQPAQPTQPTSSRRSGHSETEPVPFDGEWQLWPYSRDQLRYRQNRSSQRDTDSVEFEGLLERDPVRTTVCTDTNNEYGGKTYTTTISEWDGREMEVHTRVVKMDRDGVVRDLQWQG